ncbi:MAG: S41 family peptidase [Bacteroidales bacterium]|nr:S41 family peptidase [Bacteroidales bacterium]
MRKKVKKIFLILILCFTLIISFSFSRFGNFELVKNLDIFYSVVIEIYNKYVEDVDISKLIGKAIESMLSNLDPYTTFISEAQMEEYKLLTTSQYGGIGAIIQKRGDNFIVAEILSNSPAHKFGLKVGDVILSVNNKAVKDLNIEEVSELMKGVPNTIVKVKILRPFEKKEYLFEIKRETIKIPCIPYYGIIEDSIGYISFTNFSENSSNEFLKCFKILKSKNIKSLIIDLRNNPGGLLLEAVNIGSIFLPKGSLITYTKGKISDANNKYVTNVTPIDTTLPIVILVNRNSASASELLSGAFQDHDRAVIVGENTFGKGLVQTTTPLPFNSLLKITTAKYYTPSGRCIQNIDYIHKNEKNEPQKPDATNLKSYKTKNGRTVFESNGINPDIIIKSKDTSEISQALLANYVIFDFANDYYFKHTRIDTLNFTIDSILFNEFKNFSLKYHLNYSTKTEEKFNNLIEISKKEGYYASLNKELLLLEEKIKKIKENDIETKKSEIIYLLTCEILSRYLYEKGPYICSIKSPYDLQLQEAKKILKDLKKYREILKTKQ